MERETCWRESGGERDVLEREWWRERHAGEREVERETCGRERGGERDDMTKNARAERETTNQRG